MSGRAHAGHTVRRLEPAEGVCGEDAGVYRNIARKLDWCLTRPFAKRALSLGIRSGCALDAGCGPGRLAAHLARLAPGMKVWALDISADMLKETAARAARAGLGDRIVPAPGDMRSLPFPDDSFDLVTSMFAFHHLPDPRTALKEMLRVVRPGGAVIVQDFIRPESDRWIEWMVRFLGTLQWYGPAEREQYRDSLHAGLGRGEAERLREDGFRLSFCRPLSLFVLERAARPCCFALPGTKRVRGALRPAYGAVFAETVA